MNCITSILNRNVPNTKMKIEKALTFFDRQMPMHLDQ